MKTVLLIFLVVVVINLAKGNYLFLSSVFGEVMKDNFTYYDTHYEGTLMLELTSTTGDCDLYVSQNTIKPTYEPQNYCLQSITCGKDVIIVPKSFKRPLGIGIFGHPSHEVSQYILTFYSADDSQDIFNYNPYFETEAKTFDEVSEQTSFLNLIFNLFLTHTSSNEEEIWNLFIGFF